MECSTYFGMIFLHLHGLFWSVMQNMKIINFPGGLWLFLYPRVKYTALQTARSGGIKGQLVCTLTEYFSTVCNGFLYLFVLLKFPVGVYVVGMTREGVATSALCVETMHSKIIPFKSRKRQSGVKSFCIYRCWSFQRLQLMKLSIFQ